MHSANTQKNSSPRVHWWQSGAARPRLLAIRTLTDRSVPTGQPEADTGRQFDETRERRCHVRAISDHDRPGRTLRRNRHGHCAAMIPCTVDSRSAQFRAPLNHRAIGSFVDHRTGGRQRPRHHGNPVAFLDPQFGRAAYHGFATGKRSGHEQHRELIDHVGHPARVDFDSTQGRVSHQQVGDRLSSRFARTQLDDVGPHGAQRE